MFKRIILTLAAIACATGPMIAAATPAAAQRYDREDRRDRDGRFDRDGRRGGDDSNRGRGARWDRDGRRGGYDGEGSRRRGGDDRTPRSGRYEGRGDNEYGDRRSPRGVGLSGGRSQYEARSAGRFRRGSYLPQGYGGEVEYRGNRLLRPPPRGYRWVRVNEDYLLVAIATGLIFDVISGER